jgi:hypothetical protein
LTFDSNVKSRTQNRSFSVKDHLHSFHRLAQVVGTNLKTAPVTDQSSNTISHLDQSRPSFLAPPSKRQIRPSFYFRCNYTIHNYKKKCASQPDQSNYNRMNYLFSIATNNLVRRSRFGEKHDSIISFSRRPHENKQTSVFVFLLSPEA